jgi:hypothetical protein
MTTYNKITEQIQRLYARQYERENLMPNIDKREVRLLAIQVINELISATLKDAQRIGDVNIMSCIIATYKNQPVSVTSPNYNLTGGATTAFNLTAGSTVSYTLTGVSTINLNAVINYSTATGTLAVGDSITGTGIPPGATVALILSATSIQISAAATATNSGLTLTLFNNTINYAANSPLKVGDAVSGTGIAAGSVVSKIISTTQALLSLNTTSAVSGQTFAVLSNTITYAVNIALQVGDAISGTGIPVGATIASIISGTSATMSVNCSSGVTAQTFAIIPAHPSFFPVYTAKLPVFPLRLNMDMGVWGVYVEPYQIQCVPLPTAINDLINNLDEGLIENQIGVTAEGRTLKFIGSYQLLQNAFSGTPTVTIKLLVEDTQLLNDDDPLPIPPEYEASVIKGVLALMNAVPLNTDKQVG